MGDLVKLFVGGLMFIFGIVGTILSAYAIRFAGLSFFVVLIVWLFDIAVISGWWVIGTPVLMLVGGLIGVVLNIFATALGAAIADS